MRIQRALVLATLLAACGGDGGGGTITDPDKSRIELWPWTTEPFRHETVRIGVVVFDRSGVPVQSAVTWSSSDTLTARVDPDGTARFFRAGTAIVSAASAGKNASVTFRVREDAVRPTISDLSIEPRMVNLSTGPQTVTLRVVARDNETGPARFSVGFSVAPINQNYYGCDAVVTPVVGANQSYQCTITLNQYAPPGEWRVAAHVTDAAGNQQTVSEFDHVLTVTGSLPDANPPTLASLDLGADLVDVRTDRATVSTRVGVRDSEAGVASVDFLWAFESGKPSITGSASTRPGSSTRDAVLTVPAVVQKGHGNDVLILQSMRIYDLRGNRRELTEAQLQAAGYKTRIRIVG
jgi:hypothetical protein